MKVLSKFFVLAVSTALVACGGGGGGGGLTPPPPTAEPCSIDTQKQFVLDNMYFWYLWNDDLPRGLDIDDFETPQELLAFLSTFSPDDGSGQPVDKFSFLTSATSDQAFFGEGRFEGFGFSYRVVAPNVLRFTRVFADGPAGAAGFARGQQIVALDGRPIADVLAAEGINAALDNPTVEFTLRPVGGNPDGSDDLPPVSVTKDIVTIDPVPQWRVIDGLGGRKIGYIEFYTFISTAEPEFATIFQEFATQSVDRVIIDMRYNGGGLVRTAELLGDYLGGLVARNEVFSETRFNNDRSSNNSSEFFEPLANSLNLNEFVVIASRGTASASELVANGLGPHVNVTIVGDNTFGKPVGQIGLELEGCDVLLRPTSFQTVNSDGFGDYFGGLPVEPGCEAEDDLDVPVGSANDPNFATALYYLENSACPPPGTITTPGVATKPRERFEAPRPDLSGPPWREFADAW